MKENRRNSQTWHTLKNIMKGGQVEKYKGKTILSNFVFHSRQEIATDVCSSSHSP